MKPLDLLLNRFTQKRIQIEGDHVEYEDISRNLSLNLNEVTHMNYGITQLYINGIRMNRFYNIDLQTADPKRKIKIIMQVIAPFKRFYQNTEIKFQEIINHLKPTAKRLANDALKNCRMEKLWSLQR
ncbi:hypothetical protein IPG41_02930 [Candidatus Peregrinibacteria bacterium]|nr:MAG: hypothetical protein IPG41_02930 [Candidatus Peregrinibacteria bacterium]